jgi:farnesyl diphosphate synthase
MMTMKNEPFVVYQQRVEAALRQHLLNDPPNALFNAMQYSALDGGKRLRAKLVYATGEAFSAPWEELDVAAAAVEMVHAFSLIHDDLPAMDDDSLRRGKPTCHVAFGEATAILAGDALLAHAFDVLSTDNSPHFDAAVRLQMVQILARATGALGMTGGQYLDIQAENTPLDFAQLVEIHTLKTGCLIQASVELGFAASQQRQNAAIRQALYKFSRYIGLAFQIQDDILDVIGEKTSLGKTPGRDAENDKSTYPKALGLEQAQEEAERAYEKAIAYLKPMGEKAQALKDLAKLMVWRDR